MKSQHRQTLVIKSGHPVPLRWLERLFAQGLPRFGVEPYQLLSFIGEERAVKRATQLYREELRDPLAEIVGAGLVPAHHAEDKKAPTRGAPINSITHILDKFFKPGTLDNLGKVAEEALGILDPNLRGNMSIRSGTRLVLTPEHGELPEQAVAEVRKRFANALIENIYENGEEPPLISAGIVEHRPITSYPVATTIEELELINKERLLALQKPELEAILAHFRNPEVQQQRKALGLSGVITDLELECLGQSWSEHCKHKIMGARITYKGEQIDSLFKTYIAGATKAIDADHVVSVFTDNSGVIRFDDETNVCFKVETHNSPSALEPYGGASTGIVGVYRDILGTGLGAKPIFGTNVLCFDPDNPDLEEGVVRGIRDGGNQSGIPTVNGAVLYDPSYKAKPLVYCGAGGLMPREVGGHPSHEKQGKPGDVIAILGGRVGRDGIHGATFSSITLEDAIPPSVVQIADPFTQKRLMAVVFEAAERGILTSLTDNGAGGFSSSIGEMAMDIGGADIDLAGALLKTEGLAPWEIFLSESQERMTLATANYEALAELAAAHNVEIYRLGQFTADGLLTVRYHGEIVGCLQTDFIKRGCPQLVLEAEEARSISQGQGLEVAPATLSQDLLSLLARPNIRSKERIFTQYDAEVRGGTIVKPYVGFHIDGPTDAALLRPHLGSETGLVISCGVKPWLSDYSAYAMAAYAVDEAVRNAVCVGARLDKSALLDNYCWPDPLIDKQVLGQLVEASKALYDAAVAFGIPYVSGKDSMKNDSTVGGVYRKVLPTILVSLMAVVPNCRRFITPAFKNEGDLVYLIGKPSQDLGGSEYERMKSRVGNPFPEIDLALSKRTADVLADLAEASILQSCHDVADGGLIVALAESCMGGGKGCVLDSRALPSLEVFFAEPPASYVVSVASNKQQAFEAQCVEASVLCTLLGTVDGYALRIAKGSSRAAEIAVDDLRKAWKGQTS